MLDLRKGVSVHGGFLDYQPVYLLGVLFKKGLVFIAWVEFNNLSVSYRIHSNLRYYNSFVYFVRIGYRYPSNIPYQKIG